MLPLTLLQPTSDVKTAPGGQPFASATEAAPATAIKSVIAAIKFLQMGIIFCDVAVISVLLSLGWLVTGLIRCLHTVALVFSFHWF
jgi:hypothetical protein